MATTKADKRQRDAELRKSLKVLKRKGLYRGDLRKPPTRYARGLLKKFSDVISGRAAVVDVKRRADARLFARSDFLTRGTRVVVPHFAGEGVTYSPKKTEFRVSGRTPGVTQIIKGRGGVAGPGQRYAIPMGRGKHRRMYYFDDIDEIEEFAMGYRDFEGARDPRWQRHIQIVETKK